MSDRDVRPGPFWHALRKRLASPRMLTIVEKPGRIYVPGNPIPPREDADDPWTRVIVMPPARLLSLRTDEPHHSRRVPFLVKVETSDFVAQGHDINIPLDAAHAEAYNMLDAWSPGILTQGAVSCFVQLPVFRYYPPDAGPLFDDDLRVWVQTAEYHVELTAVP